MLMDATGLFTTPGTATIVDGVIGAVGNGANSISPWTWDTFYSLVDVGNRRGLVVYA